jgi:hypothetical protein
MAMKFAPMVINYGPRRKGQADQIRETGDGPV